MKRNLLFPVFPLLVALMFFCAGVEAAVIPVTKFRSADLPGGAPAGWALEKKTGAPSLKISKEGDNYYLHLRSQGNSSFGVRTSARVNVKDFPILSWRWKVEKMPVGGDVRKKTADDQALQVYIAFKETGFPAVLNTPVVGYVWDNEAPKGWSGRSTQIGGDKMRYIVLRNKTDKTGQWYTERRNLYEDYKKLFGDINGGEPLGVTTGLQIHINTQRTRTPAEGLIGEIYFSSETKDVAATEAAKEKIVAATPVLSAPRGKALPAAVLDDDFSRPGCVNISIAFDTNSTQVDGIPKGSVQTIMEYLVKYPEDTLVITGHTDSVGPDAFNMELSKRRAQSVKQYLVGQYAIDEHRLIVRGAGESQPVADNDTPEGQAQNRRVTIQDCPQ
jgi:outer membrane protein OmpA-like peptidoglycan-associated protein